MIAIKIKGGLGNQLFQYAAGKRLANHLGVDLYLDLNWYKTEGNRPYLLDKFNITNDKEILDTGSLTYVEESTSNFIPEILLVEDNSFLEGYWQSEKYFFDIKDIIKQEFTLKYVPNHPIIEEIINTSSVSLHIRRGDYLYVATKELGVCSSEYYNKSIQRIYELVQDPKFFIFGGDESWARQHLNLPNARYIEAREQTSYEDIYLMTLCKHNIIANSSFSWWGAYLGEFSSKIVLYPTPWFKKVKTDDLPLAAWEGVQNL